MIQTPNSEKQALFCARGELAVKSLGEFPPTRLGRVGGLPTLELETSPIYAVSSTRPSVRPQQKSSKQHLTQVKFRVEL